MVLTFTAGLSNCGRSTLLAKPADFKTYGGWRLVPWVGLPVSFHQGLPAYIQEYSLLPYPLGCYTAVPHSLFLPTFVLASPSSISETLPLILILEESVLSGSDSSALPQRTESTSGLAASQKVAPPPSAMFLEDLISHGIFLIRHFCPTCCASASLCVCVVHTCSCGLVYVCVQVCRGKCASGRAEVNDRCLL